MLFELTPDQQFLRETTAKFLANEAPISRTRDLREHPDGFDRTYWRRGADLGWTSLLVPEDQGGGSVSGRGLIDLTLIAHEFGRSGAPGPLLATNVVAAALGAAPSPAHADVLSGLLDGTTVATWCFEEPNRLPGDIGLDLRFEGDGLLLNGRKRPVEAGAQSQHFLVTARHGAGLAQVLVPAATPGVSIRPLTTLDLTSRSAVVDFNDVRVPTAALVSNLDDATAEVQQLFLQALVVQCAESVGAMERGFELTLEWAFDRYSFGRPLASYQELKHRFADMKSWLEGGHAIADAAADAVDSRSNDAADLASAAKAFIGHFGAELLQDCVQIHGGIGVTFEHDLHVFLRRLTLNRMLYGTPADHRQRLAESATTQAGVQ